jgi:hypothetical protein
MFVLLLLITGEIFGEQKKIDNDFRFITNEPSCIYIKLIKSHAKQGKQKHNQTRLLRCDYLERPSFFFGCYHSACSHIAFSSYYNN